MSEGGSWKGLLRSFIGSTITTIPSTNLAVQHYTSDRDPVLELRPEVGASETFGALSCH